MVFPFKCVVMAFLGILRSHGLPAALGHGQLVCAWHPEIRPWRFEFVISIGYNQLTSVGILVCQDNSSWKIWIAILLCLDDFLGQHSVFTSTLVEKHESPG